MVQKSPEDSGAGAVGPRYPVESVAKAAELLRLFGQHSYVRPFLGDLSERVGETVNVVTLQHTDAAFVESLEAQTPLRVG